MKKILVPCDFSIHALEAFKLAVQIAIKTEGSITVLNAAYIPVLYDPVYAGGTPLAYDPSFLKTVEADITRGFEKMNKDYGAAAVSPNLEIIHDDIISAVKRAIKKHDIDIVIMGTSGASGLKEIFIGSNTEKIVRHSPVPVLAVHHASSINSIKQILLPTTLRLDQTRFIKNIKELQQFFGATLHILLVNTPSHFSTDTEALEALEEFVKHYKLNNYELHFSNFTSEEEGIISFANKQGIDLIAMATHARKGLAHLFSGSITEDVVNHIHCPIWTSKL